MSEQTFLFPGEEEPWDRAFLASLADRLPAEEELTTVDVANAMHISPDKVRCMCESGQLHAINHNEGSALRAFWKISRQSVINHYRTKMGYQPA